MAFRAAGYSGTPLVKKLGIREGYRILFASAPDGLADLLELPPAVEFANLGDGSALDLAILFAKSQEELERGFGPLAARLESTGMLWVAWPKKASGITSDLTDNIVREYGLSTGLVDTKVCAIDETWSGLKFVIRIKDRPGRV